jgi:2,4-dienoyl-CoA reductase-like NADH-dependent reductase (Old Yellow Enzyme family)
MSELFRPMELRGLALANRLWVAPMCQYSVEEQDGVPTDWHLVHLGALATGGTGLLLTEATAVSPEGRITPQDTGLWNDEQQAAWVRIVDFAHSVGTPIGVQLAHAGRKASTHRPWAERKGSLPAEEGWTTVAPSAVAFPGYAEPAALDGAGIEKVVRDFRDAARRAVAAGFDTVEVHAAHGYLLHQFLSPLSNLRTDDHGGPLENRSRLLLDVVRAVRAVIPERMPLLVRFSGTDWAPGGWTVEDTVVVAGRARKAGADFFDVSSGGNLPAEIPLGPGYQVPLAATVRRAGLPVGAVGLITEAEQAEQIVAGGEADAVLLAREVLRNPRFPLLAAAQLGAQVPWPPQYDRAAPRVRA